MQKFTLLFLVLAAFMLWTYSVMPDIMETYIALKTGVDANFIKKMWIIALTGVLVFFIILYKLGELPS